MAARPSNATITVDGNRIDVLSAHVGLATHHDHLGLPQMGTLRTAISCMINVHDNERIPFDKVKRLFQLANVVTREKIVDIRVEFWIDDAQQDALCTYAFRGWISDFSMSSSQDTNHVLSLSLQPALDTHNFVEFTLGN